MDFRKKYRTKRHHNKVRTGCRICKQRRVKCDETHPTCGPCSRGDRDCVYDSVRAWIFEGSVKTKKSPTEAAQPNAALTPPHFNVTKETLDFRYFMENSLPLLCSFAATPETVEFSPHPSIFFDKSGAPLFGMSTDAFTRFWRELVPQVAYSDPAIWKIVCLYGSKQRAAIHAAVRDNQSVSIQAYCSALSLLSSKDASSAPPSPETIMIASMCLFAYERLKVTMEPDRDNIGMLHLRATQQLMTQFPDNPVVKEYMVPVRDHFEALIVFFRASCRAPLLSPALQQFQYDNIPVLPAMFSSCAEARDSFSAICRVAHPCGCSLGRAWSAQCLSYRGTRELLDCWLVLMTEYYHRVRATDLEEGKAAFTMLAEGYLVDMGLTLSLMQIF